MAGINARWPEPVPTQIAEVFPGPKLTLGIAAAGGIASLCVPAKCAAYSKAVLLTAYRPHISRNLKRTGSR